MTTSSFRPLLPGAVLAFGAMLVTGWKIAGPSAASSSSDVRTNAAATLPSRQPVNRRRPPAEAQQSMDAIRRSHNPLERAQATIALAESLPASSFAAWMKAGWFNVRQGPELTIFTKILLERWQKEDPDGYLDWQISSKSPEAGQALSALMKDEPEKALALLKKYPNSPGANLALQTLATTNPAAALEILEEIASRNPQIDKAYRYRELFAQLAGKDPAALEALASKFPSAYASQIKSVIWSKRLNESFAENLEKLWALPDGFRIFQNASDGPNKLNSEFFDRLGSMPASWRTSIAQNYYQFIGGENTLIWLNRDLAADGFKPQTSRQIQSYALREYSRQHPEEALQWITASGKEGKEKTDLYSSALGAFSGQPEKQKQLLASISSESDRTAVSAMLGTMNQGMIQQNRPALDPASITPDNFFSELATKTRDGDHSSLYQITQQLSNWDADQTATLTAQFQTLPDDQKGAISKAVAQIYSLPPGSELKNQAYVYLLNHPDPAQKDVTYSGLSTYVVNWSSKDPDAAGTWINTLPDGDPKTWAMKNLARNWSFYDPEAVGRWMGSLPAGQKAEVQKFLDSKK